MKDIHSHLIYGVDDGARSIEETSELLEKVAELGFDEMVLTPHFFPEKKYTTDNEKKEKILKEIKKLNSNIRLHLGNEVMIDDKVASRIKSGKIATLKGTKYVLVEFPFDVFFPVIYDYLDALIKKGFVPILAHPERYIYYQVKPDRIKPIIDKGVLIQCNYGSFVGIHGKKAKKCANKFLKKNIVYVLSLDLHSDDTVLNKFPKIKKKLIRKIGLEKFNLLSDRNIEKILKSKKYEVEAK